MAKKPIRPNPNQPETIIDPTTAEDFFARGWAHYSKKEFFRAESDFRRALELAPGDADSMFAIAQALQSSGRPVDAVAEYEKLLAVLANPPDGDRVRYGMLARMVRGHINHIKTGDWKLFE